MNKRQRHSKHKHPPSDDNKLSLVIGRNATRELLRVSPERIRRALIAGGAGRDSRFKELHAVFQENNIPVTELDEKELSGLAGTSSHQGVVCEVVPRRPLSLSEFLQLKSDAQHLCIGIIDTVYDPQNLGAIFRAAECFGIDALLWSRNRGTGITPVVSKTSAGASELVPYIEVANTARALDQLKESGFWIVAADVQGESQSISSFSFPEKTALILGSEGAGVSQLLLKKTDFRVMIPLAGNIDSLNVSQAAAIFFYSYAASGSIS